jgi:hypothetical protein
MRLARLAALSALMVPRLLQAQMGTDSLSQSSERSAVPPASADKNTVYTEIEYVSGHEGFDLKKKGQMVVTAGGVEFFDNKGERIFTFPIATIQNAEHTRDIRDASVGKKLLFGGLAGDRKQDFLTLTIETDSNAEGVVFKAKQNAATGIAAKINFYVKKSRAGAPPPQVAKAAPAETAAVFRPREQPVPPPVAAPIPASYDSPPASPTTALSVSSRSTLRTNAELAQNTAFRLASGDAQRVGLVTGFREIGLDTLAVDLTDTALSSNSTESQLGRLFAAYVRITSFSRGSAFLLQHGGQSIGEYTSTGLARGDWR